jgi:transposase InsO family protein
MCKFFEVSRSAYYAWRSKRDFPDKDAEITSLIREGYYRSHKTYGYRRIRLWIQREYGVTLNEKRIRRIMAKEGIQSIARKRLKYKRYHDQMHSYGNILNRDFKAEAPNQKWVTDITYIPTKQGFLYLSVIKDLYDNYIVSYEAAPMMTLPLVTRTIEKAMAKEKVADGLVLHSDQGFQYTSQAYYNLTKKYNITPSMSRKGNCYDNACCENFFSHLKEECIRHWNIENKEVAKEIIKEYINFYNNERIQLKSEKTPYEKRYQLAS